MKKITVNSSHPYDVYVGRSLFESGNEIQTLLKQMISDSDCLIVTDDIVGKLCLDRIKHFFTSADIRVGEYILPHGEENKNMHTVLSLLDHMAEKNYSRGDYVISLGGGVVGDTAAFAASIFKRGLKLIHIPTTLLSAVDSSIGGKCGVNHENGKNLIGSFHSPEAVLCDVDFFETLSRKEIMCGLGEILKYSYLENFVLPENVMENKGETEALVGKCISIKADIVSEDEKDVGRRHLLNLGHTFGHAIEQFSYYRVPHGEAVAKGLILSCRMSRFFGLCDESLEASLIGEEMKLGFDVSVPYRPDDLTEYLFRDKKGSSGGIDFVFPVSRGNCIIKRISRDEMRRACDEILS